MGRVLTEEQKAKMKAGRARQAAEARANKVAAKAVAKGFGVEDPSDAQSVAAYAEKVRDGGSPSEVSSAISMLASAIKEAQSSNNENLVEALSESHRRLVRPENSTSPMVSAFNPEGERDHPRPVLKANINQCGFPVLPKASTREEIELLNMFIDKVEDARRTHTNLPPMLVTKADGSQALVKLNMAWNDATGRLETLDINYPVKTFDMRSGLYSFVHMLRELLGMGQPQVDSCALLARIRALESENAQLKHAQR